jgi:hypothetical protein
MAHNVFRQDRRERTSIPSLFSRRRHEIVLDVVAPHVLIRANQIQKLVFVPRRRKGKEELVRAGLRIADECQSVCIR